MLCQPPSSPEGSPVCAPSAQQAVSHVCLEGVQFPWASTHRCQELSPVMTAVGVPRYCPLSHGVGVQEHLQLRPSCLILKPCLP